MPPPHRSSTESSSFCKSAKSLFCSEEGLPGVLVSLRVWSLCRVDGESEERGTRSWRKSTMGVPGKFSQGSCSCVGGGSGEVNVRGTYPLPGWSS